MTDIDGNSVAGKILFGITLIEVWHHLCDYNKSKKQDQVTCRKVCRYSKRYNDHNKPKGHVCPKDCKNEDKICEYEFPGIVDFGQTASMPFWFSMNTKCEKITRDTSKSEKNKYVAMHKR